VKMSSRGAFPFVSGVLAILKTPFQPGASRPSEDHRLRDSDPWSRGAFPAANRVPPPTAGSVPVDCVASACALRFDMNSSRRIRPGSLHPWRRTPAPGVRRARYTPNILPATR
jgi:hypothetical protein